MLYALERMELLRWAAWAREGAAACLLEQDTMPYGVTEYPPGLEEEIDRLFATAVRIDPHAIRTRISPKVKNTVLLGHGLALHSGHRGGRLPRGHPRALSGRDRGRRPPRCLRHRP